MKTCISQDDYADFVLHDTRMNVKQVNGRDLFRRSFDDNFVEKASNDHRLNKGENGRLKTSRTGAGHSNPMGNNLPWGHMLAPTVEEKLPTYANIVATTGLPKDGVWQTVGGTRFKFFIYSAFYDRRNGRSVRVIGATKTRNPERVWCRLFYSKAGNGSDVSVTIIGRVKIIRENWNLKYSACFVICPLREQDKVLAPDSVSIVARLRMPPKNLLVVQKSDHDPSLELLFNNSVANGFTNASSLFAWNENRNTREFLSGIPDRISMCVKPLHFNYDQALHLLEFLELNSILGVSHVTFYNHTIGRRAKCILNKYMDGTRNAILRRSLPEFVPTMTITLLPWILKMESQKEIRTEGLFAALNDCLYRNMYSYSHVLFIDLDEFIIPRHNRTLNELLKGLVARPPYRQSSGAFSFQNGFFYLQFPDDNASAKDPLERALLTQRKTQRRKKLHPQKQRSKYIAKPEAVIEAGNHFVWEFMVGKGHLNVRADVAILHHYRICEFGGNDCINAPSVQDRTAHKYAADLVARIRALYTNLKAECNLPKWATPKASAEAPTNINTTKNMIPKM